MLVLDFGLHSPNCTLMQFIGAHDFLLGAVCRTAPKTVLFRIGGEQMKPVHIKHKLHTDHAPSVKGAVNINVLTVDQLLQHRNSLFSSCKICNGWHRGGGRASDWSRARGFESRLGSWRKNSVQVSRTYVLLSPSSISWYWLKGGDARCLGR